MRRRDLCRTSLSLSAAALAPRWVHAQDEPTTFGRSTVIERARALASGPFERPRQALPDYLRELSYSQYLNIRFKPEAQLWRDESIGFRTEMFHPGFIYDLPVEMHVVENGQARRLEFRAEMFEYGEGVDPPEQELRAGFAGFRVRAHLNLTEVWDEFLVFLGASYFRAVGRGQVYGLSARGLAIATGEPSGEEFPFFRAFWIEKPDTNVVVIHALLDSPSLAGAYRFTVRPGDPTVMDVELTLFARTDASQLGLAPLTSMFLFNAKSDEGFDDFRPAVHDSDGLLIWNGRNEWLWRPLHNPEELQISAFLDTGPRGFGLVQRERRFDTYEDLEALYHKRPTLWVEPIGDWQRGSVVLVEIPTDQEIHDNIVAFWRPNEPLRAGQEASFTYRLHWGWSPPQRAPGPQVTRTLSGAGTRPGRRLFVVDYNDLDGEPVDLDGLEVSVNSSQSQTHNVVAIKNPESGGVRVSFEIDTEGLDLVETRLDLMRNDRPFGESWVYRWTA